MTGRSNVKLFYYIDYTEQITESEGYFEVKITENCGIV